MPVARIQSITELWVQIIRLELEGGFEDGFRFAAGQYLEIEHPSGVGIPLSIASAPHRLPQLELHYRATPGDALAPLFDDLLEVGGGLELRGPFGDVIVTSPTAPLLLAAGGTGISQALGIIEHIQHLASRPAVTLLWCVESADALYARERLEALPWLDAHYIVDARKTPDNDGLVWLGQHLSSKAYDRVLLCGGPAFVYAVVDHLEVQKPDAALESDVFGYSPRG